MMELPRSRRCGVGLGAFAKCERGNITIIAYFLLVPIILATGFAVDLARIWLVQSRLQTSVDAAALVAGRGINTSTRDADATAIYWSNFGRYDKVSNAGYLSAVASVPTITTLDADTIKVTATAAVNLTLMGLVKGIAGQTETPTIVNATASTKRALYGMELALVLDITGSMKSNDNIGGLRTAATNLVDIVFGSSDTQPNLLVSVVPFTASVNMGKQHTDWLAAGSLDQSKYGSSGWAGCVEARTGTVVASGEDSTDSPPASVPFQPTFWPSTKGKYFNGTTPVTGDNDWAANNITEGNQTNLPDNTAVGPNLACPAVAIQPLTPSKSKVMASVNALVATFRGGTTGNLGLQAGWFTLSPRWSGLWGTANSPLPYNTLNMQKVVVFMTDGNNEWYDWPGGAPGAAPSAYNGQVVDADYTAYGRLSQNRLGITLPNTGNINGDTVNAIANAKVELNNRTTKICTAMKQSGVVIYTVILGSLDSTTKTLWQNCASKPENYFNSPNKAVLATAFQQIGSQLAGLRLTQ